MNVTVHCPSQGAQTENIDPVHGQGRGREHEHASFLYYGIRTFRRTSVVEGLKKIRDACAVSM